MSSNTWIWEYLAALDARRSQAKTSLRSLRGKAAGLADRHKGFFALCDQGLVSATNFATAVIIGRVCGKAELGVYTLAWTLMTLATDVSGMLTTTPYTVFSPQLKRSRRRRYLGSILVHQLLLSLIFALAMAAGALLSSWKGWLSHGLSNVIMITAGVIVFIGLREFVRRVSFAELKLGWALSVDVVACLAQGGGLLLLLHFGTLTASRTFILLGISSAVAAAGWLVLNRKAFRTETRLFGQDLKRNWNFAKWVLGSGILSTIARYLYPWVLAAFHGISVTGVWAACAAIVALGNPAILGLGNYILPKISNIYAASGAAAMRRDVRRFSVLFTAMLLPAVLVLAVGGERIVTGIYGSAYAGNASILLLLGLNMLVNSLTNPYSQGLFSMGCAKADTLVNVVWVTLLFTGGVAAVRWYAALGAAAALFVSSCVTAAIRVGVFDREVRRHSPAALDLAHITSP
jgi:O-antigen/teichoic acid export membrane protein